MLGSMLSLNNRFCKFHRCSYYLANRLVPTPINNHNYPTRLHKMVNLVNLPIGTYSIACMLRFDDIFSLFEQLIKQKMKLKRQFWKSKLNQSTSKINPHKDVFFSNGKVKIFRKFWYLNYNFLLFSIKNYW